MAVHPRRRRVPLQGQPYNPGSFFDGTARLAARHQFMNFKHSVVRASGLVVSVLAASWLLAGCGSTPKDETAGWTTDKLYSEAKDEASSGGYERAAKLYERLEGRAAGTVLAQQAEVERAYVLYKSGESAQALSTLDRFIKLHPTSPAVDYALYLKGLVNINDDLGLFGNWSHQDLSERDQQASHDAYQSFKQLVEQFPDSRYAEDAQQRMNYITNSLAAYEVHVASYYFRRGAYVAAANRAQQTVQDFQHSPSIEEALFIMASSYDRLELPKLRDDAERVLRQNFPQSPFLGAQGLQEKKKPWWKPW
jgi:outer membrane protein assembly factor BamD